MKYNLAKKLGPRWNIIADPFYSGSKNGMKTVAEVCPEDVCHLYGCDEDFLNYLNMQLDFAIVIVILMISFYFTGTVTLLCVNRNLRKETQNAKIEESVPLSEKSKSSGE